ncbi:MAG: adenine deaminase, partial [Anaerolinea sp.]|nr:adenine deaminase [Anaerolinea sp.]
GFIDAHVHIESSLCTPPEFARAVAARGVTSVVIDPHEIANVLGLDGIRFMIERGADTPINVFVMASSCVPATHMETSGATLRADDLASLLNDPRVLGLAEMMNYPGVINGDEDVLDKLTAFAGRVLDGHSPGVTGRALNAYIAAGIMSDHECVTAEEARERLRRGMTVFIREGTTTRNLRSLLPVVTAANHGQICFCTDDRTPASLIDEGSIDHLVRTAIAEGVDPVIAIRMGTINTARYFRLHDRGAVALGRKADLLVTRDLRDLRAEQVYCNGVLIAERGAVTAGRAALKPRPVAPSMRVGAADQFDFAIPAPAGKTRIHVIGGLPDQVVTEHHILEARIVNGQAVSDPDRDLLKIAVIERHTASGRIAKGFITGYGLKRGALAGTVAHDHHNLVVIGVDDHSMATAARAVIALGGGLAVADGDQVLGTLALPVAGLMSEAPIEDVRRDYDALITIAQSLGSQHPDPFMGMSFMALEVIPALKLTDVGLVDVEQFRLIDLFE